MVNRGLMLWHSALLLIYVPVIFSQGGIQTTNFTLVLFNESYAQQSGARCMDGSPAGYYIREGSPTNRTKWILWFQGGGACVNTTTCAPRVNTSLGSSLFLPSQPAVSSYSFETQDPQWNPDFHDWNHVFLFYCTSDVWLGNVRNVSGLPNGMQYYFSGHLTTVAVLNALVAKYAMNWATRVIVTGSSAGGVGSFYHTDYIASRFPSANVVGAPMAGWDIIGPTWDDYLNDPSAPRNYSQRALRASYVVQIYNATDFFSPACIKDVIATNTSPSAYWYAIAFCQSPVILYSYLSSDLFISNNLFDYWEILMDNGVPISQLSTDNRVVQYLQMFGATMAKNLTGISRNDAVWAPSCYQHTPVAFNAPSSGQPTIRSMTFQQAFRKWYFTNPRTHMSWIADYSIIWGNCSVSPFRQDFQLFNSPASTTTTTSSTTTKSTSSCASSPQVFNFFIFTFFIFFCILQ